MSAESNPSNVSPTPSRRLRVLLSAYACEPDKSSEPGVGWNHVLQAARFHDVWVVVAEEHRAATEAYLKTNPMPNVQFIWVEIPAWMRFYKKGERGRRIHYYIWQYAAWRTIRKIHEQVKFDIVHHVTYVTYWTPSFVSRTGAPFVWGPVGGAESAPRPFYPTLSAKGRRNEMIRDAVRGFAQRFDPFVRETAGRARITFATTQETAAKVRILGGKDIRLESESALPADDIEALTALPLRENASPFRLISVGRLIGWKGYHLGVAAFAEFRKRFPESEYWLLGSGAEREGLEKLAADLNLGASIKFWGQVPRTGPGDSMWGLLSQCDVLVHPSLHDSGGWICLEGMAAGRPVLCLDLGGPGVQVTDQTGIKVPGLSPDQAIRDLAKGMETLATSPEMRARMGAAGRERVREFFDWDKKGQRLADLYREIAPATPNHSPIG